MGVSASELKCGLLQKSKRPYSVRTFFKNRIFVQSRSRVKFVWAEVVPVVKKLIKSSAKLRLLPHCRKSARPTADRINGAFRTGSGGT
jgi:hypothetical protein